ncbi:MAG: DNA polymerase III subunit chi [Wenzhouxiangellaceae bacterium]|nr:DNA polymerase III subunit chi [Wenzhouxiangellaceae bacterium]
MSTPPSGKPPRVDFYQINGGFRTPLEVAGILVGKAFPGAREIVITGPRAALEVLDEQLWERPEGRFLPHGIDAAEAPIRLTETCPAQAEILINLDPEAELPSGQYQRVLEIVPPDEALKARLRERWSAWKARGAELHHHVLK